MRKTYSAIPSYILHHPPIFEYPFPIALTIYAARWGNAPVPVIPSATMVSIPWGGRLLNIKCF